ncbi:MAG: TetR family transcriptional regulator, partial [Synergistaceae bacterium]
MPRKTKEDSIKTRDLLLEASLDVFSEKSFSDVTLSEIAERVGMTMGALYWQFKNN